MSSPKVLSSKKNFTSVNDAWEAYYSENKFAISSDVQKALKYIPIYYQKKNLTAMAAAYSCWNGAEQRFEVFCPKNAVFRSTNLHELGHIYFGHLKNSRKYMAMAERMLKPYRHQLANFLQVSCCDVIHDIINICMDFEINSKLFVTNKEREELNASVQFYLLRRYDTSMVRTNITNFDPDKLSKETIIYFPENFGFPGKKSFLEYIQMMIDYCIHHKKPEIPQNGTGDSHDDNSQMSNGSKGTASFFMPTNEDDDNSSEYEDDEADSPINKEEDNNSDNMSDMPSLEKNEEVEDKPSTEETENTENKSSDGSAAGDTEKSSGENTLEDGENSNVGPQEDDNLPKIEDVDDNTFAHRFRQNQDTQDEANRIKKEDSQAARRNSEPLYELEGETLENEIDTAENWMKKHENEEQEINDLKGKIEVASNASDINNFILRNALPSIDVYSYNDILYNYNRGKTTDVFINKVRTRSTFRKPNVHIYTDVSGSMDPEYTKKIVKAVKAISSRIDNRSSLTFYNEWDLNTEKFNTLSDEVINRSFVGGGTELARALRRSYVKTQENNSANTLVIISDFCDNMAEIKKQFDNIKSTIICIEVGNYNNDNVAEDFENYGIKNAKLLKVVDRKYAA